MSEQFPHKLEQLERLEHQLELPEHAEATAQPAPEQHHAKALAEARDRVAESVQEQEPTSPLERLKQAEKAPDVPARGYINHELRAITQHRELRHLQGLENPVQRQFSKLIHQPAVRATSEAAARTVSRPSGLLGGGLVALVGTSSYLYLAKHIGFSYNYGVFALLFIGGFILGLVLEFILHLAISHSRQPID